MAITSQKPCFIIKKTSTSASIDLASFSKKAGFEPVSVAFFPIKKILYLIQRNGMGNNCYIEH